MNVKSLRKQSRINGRYEVRGRIGTGWEGVTYLVRDRLDGRQKALKFITNIKRRKSILSQARVLVQLQHPNIIDYYNVDRAEVDGESHYFLLVEYLEGPRLSETVTRLHRLQSPPLFYFLRICYQIFRGMAYVHDQRILHDDLHTDNIILVGDPEAPTPKLFDFWGSRGANHRVMRSFDLKCAGQVLFECLTGKEHYSPGELDAVPRELADIIRRTQARVHNYSNFHQVLADFEELRAWD